MIQEWKIAPQIAVESHLVLQVPCIADTDEEEMVRQVGEPVDLDVVAHAMHLRKEEKRESRKKIKTLSH